MNKIQLHFGDYWNDGHGLYRTVFVETPKTCDEIRQLSYEVQREYPEFKYGFADEYGEPYFSKHIWDILVRLGYPIERFRKAMDDRQYNEYKTLADVPLDWETYVTIDLVADVWIWMLNLHGAGLTVVEDMDEHIAFDFGYGCFVD